MARRAALALILGAAGALLFFGSGGRDGSGQANSLAALVMWAGLIVGLALLAGSLMRRSS